MTTNFTVTDETEWDAAIFAIDADYRTLRNESYTITLAAPSGILSLAANAPAIETAGTVTVIGNSETLNGDGMVRGIFVSAGTVVLQDLTIANMTARGGNGGPGGGGGAGLGGGLMVMSQASAVLDGVTFINDSAIGGNGGAGLLGGGGGLGGNGGAAGVNGGGIGGGSGMPGGYSGRYSGANGGPFDVFAQAGYGGGGGSGPDSSTFHGGFGGGGGGGYGRASGGYGGGAGVGSDAASGGGGGGLGAGGAIFLANNASLTIISGSISGSSAAGGIGANGAGNGAAAGDGIYIGRNFHADAAIALAPPQGKRVTIADSMADATSIAAFRGPPLLVSGAGTVELLAANSIPAGITIDGGTLELGVPGAAGSGEIHFAGQPGGLTIAGAVMPTNMITGFGIGQTIDLRDVVATSATATLNASGGLAIPTASGSVALKLDPLTVFSGGTFSLAPDGHGGTRVTTNANPVGGVVTVTGATGGVFVIPYVNNLDTGSAAQHAAEVDSQITQGLTTRVVVSGAPLPAVPAGRSLVLYDTIGQSVVLPDTVRASLFSNAPGVTTVTSGAVNADLVVVGDGGLDFTAGLGIFNVYAGGGQKTVNIAPGAGGGYFLMGNGDATINAIGGNNNINLGTGNHVLTLGIGSNGVLTSGNNTVMGGPGSAIIYHGGAGTDLVLFGSGANSYSTSGSATVAGGAGNDNIYNNGTGAVTYFAGTGSGSFLGAGTVVGNTGKLQAYSPSLVFAGTGATSVTASIGTSTVVANPAGHLVLTEYYGSAVLFAQGDTTVETPDYYSGGPLGSATVLGISGTLTTSSARGLFLAPPGGNNHINVSSDSTVFGAAGGDVLSASDLRIAAINGTASNILVGGAGAETISGVGSTANNVFFAGSGPEFIGVGDWTTAIVTGTGAETIVGGKGIALIGFVNGNHPDVLIQGFDPAKDYLTFINYGTGEAAAALAGAQSNLGTETLTLSDGTHITLQGFTGLTAANIL